MMAVTKPIDADIIKVQPNQAGYKDYITQDFLSKVQGDTYTYFENDGAKAIVGMQKQWNGRALVWAFIGNVSSWIRFHKEVLAIMTEHVRKHGIIRLEMTTEVGFVESERWAKMLGFKEESTLEKYGPDGKDHKMMVRIWQQQSQ